MVQPLLISDERVLVGPIYRLSRKNPIKCVWRTLQSISQLDISFFRLSSIDTEGLDRAFAHCIDTEDEEPTVYLQLPLVQLCSNHRVMPPWVDRINHTVVVRFSDTETIPLCL